MKIHSVTVEGFRSFATAQTWRPGDDAPGLYQLTGVNSVEPELEANGAGKSSLWEALFWCLYGRTSRGLKAGTVQCWLPESPRCRVAVTFETSSESQIRTVVRTWNPNTLTLTEEVDGGVIGINNATRPVAQEEVERLIGIGPQAFLQAIYHAQFAPHFADLAPAERLDLLSEVSGLGRFEEAAEAAGELSRELEALHTAGRERLARLEGGMQQLRSRDWDAELAVWEERRATRQEAAKRTLATQRATAEQLRGAAKLAERQSKAAEASVDLSPLIFVADGRTAALVAAERNLAGAERDITSARAARERLSKLDEGACSRCGQRITAEHLAGEIASADHAIRTAEAAAEPYRLAVDQTRDMLVGAKADLEKGRLLDRERQQRAAKLAQEAADRTNKLRSAEEAIARYEAEIAQLVTEANPYAAEKQRAEEELARHEQEASAIRADVDEAARGARAAAYWQRGFRELRLFAVDRLLAQLEVETNNALSSLGMPGWKLRFSVEQETKSGTLKRGFAVLVDAPHSTEAVPFEAWSGGEAQRLRLAIAFGMSDLIDGQLGLNSSIETWDEPSTWMSAAGIDNMLDALAERAASRGRRVWLADHRALDYGGFAGGLLAEKTTAGTVLSEPNQSVSVEQHPEGTISSAFRAPRNVLGAISEHNTGNPRVKARSRPLVENRPEKAPKNRGSAA